MAAEIKKNLRDDELEHEDVLVVFPEAYTLSSEAAIVSRALQALGIASHVAGVTRSQDELFHKRSVAICHIHRAKGNEAPVVYVMNAQECYAGPEFKIQLREKAPRLLQLLRHVNEIVPQHIIPKLKLTTSRLFDS